MNAQLFFDIGTYAGIIALITVVIDFLKKFGVITEPEQGKKWAGVVQTVLSIALWAVGTFAPDLLAAMPIIDDIAGLLAEIGVGLLGLIPLAVLLGQKVHDVLADLPGFNFFAHRVS